VSPGFEGELKCIEVDQSGAPINGNNLKGEVTLVSYADSGRTRVNDTSKYNAIGVIGLNDNDSNTVLCLGGDAGGDCPFGAEYHGCPEQVLLSHYAENATNPVVEAFGNGPSSVFTELTIVPCTQNFETQQVTEVGININSYNEFESVFSSSTRIQCWDNFRLSAIRPVFDVGAIGSRFVHTVLRTPGGSPGFVAVMEEFHTQMGGANPTRAAANVHVVGERTRGDLITLPEGP
jgi:hypothetical protein